VTERTDASFREQFSSPHPQAGFHNFVLTSSEGERKLMISMRSGKILVAMAALGLRASLLAQNPAATINVDVNASRKPISPLIYGVAHGEASLSDLNAPLNRSGGNNTTRYNWQLNADNRGQDWYFQSIPEPSATPAGRAHGFINQTRAAGAEPMFTVPMIEWVAKLGSSRSKLASYSIAKYGAQTGNDWQWMPDAGNGVLASNGQNITWNDPNDANVPNSAALQQQFVLNLVSTFGTAANGGLRYYILDNEHSIWFSTHRDVAPTGKTMDEIRQKMVDFGTAIRDADSSALIVGPEEWGWSGYFYSGYDQQYAAAHGWCCWPDRDAHGGQDYMPWLLDQLRQHEVATGKRLLDVFSLHYYPQGGEFSNDTSTSMQLLRNRSTRALWDAAYTDPTWIADEVMLIPRMKQWVAQKYPGLKIGLTEYNWGAEGHINGATTQADIYGIFGREGLDIGARWTTPASTTPTYKAMKMYRNYDGQKSTFGDVSVSASTATNPDKLSAYAAERTADGALTVMVISKYLSGTTTTTINLASFAGSGAVQWWRLDSSNAIQRVSPDPVLSGSSLTVTVGPQSVNLFVLGAGTPDPNVIAAPTGLTISAKKGATTARWTDNSSNETSFQIERATQGSTSWTVVATVGANVTSTSLTVPRGSWSFRVRAINSATGAASGYSNVVNVRVR
jgi:hypothetical protein